MFFTKKKKKRKEEKRKETEKGIRDDALIMSETIFNIKIFRQMHLLCSMNCNKRFFFFFSCRSLILELTLCMHKTMLHNNKCFTDFRIDNGIFNK